MALAAVVWPVASTAQETEEPWYFICSRMACNVNGRMNRDKDCDAPRGG